MDLEPTRDTAITWIVHSLELFTSPFDDFFLLTTKTVCTLIALWLNQVLAGILNIICLCSTDHVRGDRMNWRKPITSLLPCVSTWILVQNVCVPCPRRIYAPTKQTLRCSSELHGLQYLQSQKCGITILNESEFQTETLTIPTLRYNPRYCGRYPYNNWQLHSLTNDCMHVF